MTARRLPLEPLYAYVTRTWGHHDETGPISPPSNTGDGRGNDSSARIGPAGIIATCTGYSRTTVYRWDQDGGITPNIADKVATKLGTHPTLIWGADFHADINTEEVAA